MPTLIIIMFAAIILGTIWGYESWLKAKKKAVIEDKTKKLIDEYLAEKITAEEYQAKLRELFKNKY